jgi:hypothetical protein
MLLGQFKGPWLFKLQKTDFKVYEQKGNVCFEGAHATKISTYPGSPSWYCAGTYTVHSLPHPHVHTQGIKIKILYNHFPLHTLPAASTDTL